MERMKKGRMSLCRNNNNQKAVYHMIPSEVAAAENQAVRRSEPADNHCQQSYGAFTTERWRDHQRAAHSGCEAARTLGLFADERSCWSEAADAVFRATTTRHQPSRSGRQKPFSMNVGPAARAKPSQSVRAKRPGRPARTRGWRNGVTFRAWEPAGSPCKRSSKASRALTTPSLILGAQKR